MVARLALILLLLAPALAEAQLFTGSLATGGLGNPVGPAQGGLGGDFSASTGILYDAAGAFSAISCTGGLLVGGAPPSCPTTIPLAGLTLTGAPTWGSTQTLNTSGNAATATTLAGPLSEAMGGFGANISAQTGYPKNAAGSFSFVTAIPDTDLGTIATALKVSNSATTAASANTASAIVARDGSGNFSAGTITASLTGSISGNAATATALAADPADCAAGQIALGVVASGGATCTATPTVTSVTLSHTSGSDTDFNLINVTGTNYVRYSSTGGGGSSTLSLRDDSAGVDRLVISSGGVVGISGTQFIFQRGGVTGTLQWAPATSNKTLVLPNGSTDFTATGGTSQVVQQASAGAAFTVGQLAFSNLSGSATNAQTTATSANTASAIVARDASGNFIAGAVTAALTGNASTASALATARTINGTSFDGSGNITVTAAAGTLTGTTLNSTVVTSSLASVGTMTGGTASTGFVVGGVTVTVGSDATGDMYYRNSSGVFTRIAPGAQNTILAMGASSVPAWTASPSLTTVSASGGLVLTSTNASSAAANRLVEDFSGGGRVIAWGADASTNGNLIFGTIRSDASNFLTPLTISASGGITMANLTTATGTPNSICQNSATKEVTVNAALTCTVSSRRFKDNITDQGPALPFVLALHPVSYTMKGEREELVGLLAEDVAQLDPRLVSYDAQGRPHAVRYEHMVSVLAKALQEVTARLDALEYQGPRFTLTGSR